MATSDSPDILRIKALIDRRAALDARARQGASADRDRLTRELRALDEALDRERHANPAMYAAAAGSSPAPVEPRAEPEVDEIPPDWDLYEPRSLLGEGGMGRVYRVFHRGWGIDLAVKVPRKSSLDERARRAVAREAESWSGLGLHPFVTTCYYTRVRDGVPWLFAEYVEGGSLQQAIRRGSLYDCEDPLARVLSIAIQSARGLHHAHERSLVHQDVKPANILLAPGFIAKVTDFGLARAAQAPDAKGPKPTQDGTMVVRFGGMTPAYASPEQIAASQGSQVAITRRTDAFSWAATVLEMFAGGLTWMAGPAAPDALAMLLHDGPPTPAIPTIPPELVALLERCFAPRQSARPATLAIIADELAALYAKRCGRALLDTTSVRRSPADALYNRGASKLDLDEADVALTLFEEALRADPTHPQATFGRALLRWRRGLCTDDEAVRALTEARAMRDPSWESAVLSASLHAERGDVEDARASLNEVSALGAGSPEAIAAVARISPALRESLDRVGHVELNGASLPDKVTLSRDGQLVGTMTAEEPADRSTRSIVALTSADSSERARWAVDGLPRALWVRRDATAVAVTSAGIFSLDRDNQTVLRATNTELAAFSASGELVATTAEDGRTHVLLFDPRTRREKQFTVAGRATLAALSRDAMLVALGEARGVAIYDVTSQLRLWSIALQREPESLAFAPDGRTLVVGGWDEGLARGVVIVLRSSNGERLATIRDPSPPRAVAVTNDSELVTTLSADGALRLWTVRDGRCTRTERPRSGAERVVAIATAGDKARLAAVRASSIDIFATDRRPLRAHVPVLRPLTSEEAFERDRTVAQALERCDASIRAAKWQDALTALERAERVEGSTRAPAVRRAWSRLARVCDRGDLRGAWTGAGFEAVAGAAHTVELAPDGETFYVTTGDTRILAIESRSGRIAGEIRFSDAVRTFQVAPASGAIVVARGSVIEWREPLTAALVASRDVSTASRRLATDPTGARVVLVGSDRLELVGLNAASRVLSVPTVNRAAFVGDGDMLVVASTAAPTKLVDFDGVERGALPNSEAAIDVVCTTDGRFCAVGLRDGTARVYELPSMSPVAVLPHGAVITGVALSQDGRVLVAVDAAGQVRVWDVVRERAFALGGHETFVHDVAVTPCGSVAATGGRDGRARALWIDWDLRAPADGHRWSADAERAMSSFISRGLAKRHDALRAGVLAVRQAGGGPVDAATVRTRVEAARAER